MSDLLQMIALFSLAAAGAVVHMAGLWRSDRALLQVARTLELLLAADLARLALALLVLAPARATGHVPFSGGARCGFFLSQALFLAWPMSTAALIWRLFTRVRMWPVLALFAAVNGMLIVRYPTLRGAELGDAYRWVQVGAVVLALVAFIGERPAFFRAGRAHLCALLLVAGSAAELAGPYLTAEPFTTWWTAQVTWIVTLIAVAVAATWSTTWTRSRTS